MILPSLLVFLFGLLVSAGAIAGASIAAHAPAAALEAFRMIWRGVVRLRNDIGPGLSARRFMGYDGYGTPLSFSNLLKVNRVIR